MTEPAVLPLQSGLNLYAYCHNNPVGYVDPSGHEGILLLVDRSDHSHNFGIYHPTGKGGRDIWGGGKARRQGKIK